MKKISTIIPVYNAENTIERCIESIEKQDLDDCEIICVDDGSADKSVEKIVGLQNKYSNLCLIRQENSYAGIARNNGLKVAKGRYIHFMDADDFLLPNVYSELYNMAMLNDLDYLKVRSKTVDFNTGKMCDVIADYSFNDISCFNMLMDFEKDYFVFKEHTVTPWSGIIKKELLEVNHIIFNNLKCVNDRSFYIEMMLHANRIMISDIFAVCHQVNNHNSLVGIRLKNFDCHFKSIYIIKKLIANCSSEFRNNIFATEIEDMLAWYELIRDTSKKLTIRDKIREFIENIDGGWIGNELASNKLMLDFCEWGYADVFLKNLIIKTDNELLDCLKDSNEIAIYGAGQVAELFVAKLSKLGLKESISYIAISDKKNNPPYVMDIPVLDIKKIINKKTLFLIATKCDAHMPIINVLERRGFKRYKIISLNAKDN